MGAEFTNSGMERIVERFPELAASIQERFHADKSLREMCSDYAETLKTLQRWQASDGPHKAARIEEYRELAEGLEIEIAGTLRSPPPGTKRSI
jgi:hypothetical protein